MKKVLLLIKRKRLLAISIWLFGELLFAFLTIPNVPQSEDWISMVLITAWTGCWTFISLYIYDEIL